MHALDTAPKLDQQQDHAALDLYAVRTPEMVDFHFQLAGPCSRFLAWVIDELVQWALFVLVLVIGLVVGISGAIVGGELGLLGLAIIVLATFAIRSFYHIVFEMRWNGQSPGKRALRLRVLSEEGTRVSFHQSMTRNLLRFLDGMPLGALFMSYLFGLTAMLVSSKRQRVGDLLAGTVVVREKQRTLPEELKLPTPKYNSLLQNQDLLRRISRGLRPEERELLLEIAQRRDEIDLETRAGIFTALAEHLRPRFEAEAGEEFLSDEKWVLNFTQAILENERRIMSV